MIATARAFATVGAAARPRLLTGRPQQPHQQVLHRQPHQQVLQPRRRAAPAIATTVRCNGTIGSDDGTIGDSDDANNISSFWRRGGDNGDGDRRRANEDRVEERAETAREKLQRQETTVHLLFRAYDLAAGYEEMAAWKLKALLRDCTDPAGPRDDHRVRKADAALIARRRETTRLKRRMLKALRDMRFDE